jgi:hypothetical protein
VLHSDYFIYHIMGSISAANEALLLALYVADVTALDAVLAAHGPAATLAAVRQRARGRETPLHLAMSRVGEYVGVARWLVAHGADVEAKAGDGATPVWQAACGGELALARFLVLEAGADPKAANKWGRAPLFHAECNDHPQTAAFLRTARKRKSTVPLVLGGAIAAARTPRQPATKPAKGAVASTKASVARKSPASAAATKKASKPRAEKPK